MFLFALFQFCAVCIWLRHRYLLQDRPTPIRVWRTPVDARRIEIGPQEARGAVTFMGR